MQMAKGDKEFKFLQNLINYIFQNMLSGIRCVKCIIWKLIATVKIRHWINDFEHIFDFVAMINQIVKGLNIFLGIHQPWTDIT